MSRLMIDDPSMSNPLALLTTAKLAALSDAVAPDHQYLKATGDAEITISEHCVFTIGEQSPTSIFTTQATVINSGNLDTGTFLAGKNYYVYICDSGSDTEVYKISLNSTFPNGYNAINSRKIGGFHYGKCRRINALLRPINASNVAYGAGWEGNVYDGIVPRSVWTLRHRPKCSPEGMTFLGSGVWADIYLSSDDGNSGLQSVLGGIPLTGTEGHNWYSFNDRALAKGKRLLTYSEFCKMAYGSPQGNAGDNVNAWSATTNTARNPAGGVANAVSAIGCRDAAGNVWEWLDELITRGEHYVFPTSGTFGAYDGGRAGQAYTAGNGHGTTGAWNWDTFTPLGDTTGGNPANGNIHQFYDYSLVALLGGGGWDDGAGTGARAVTTHNYPWLVYANIGVRLACDCL